MHFHRVTTFIPRRRENTPHDEERREEIRQRIMTENAILFGPRPPGLPPSRIVDHSIPLIDEKKKYHYYLSKCPDALRPRLLEKINNYLESGWWEPCQTDQAAPMLCIPKKNGDLRAVCDLRQRNENTVKDVTPFPDQDQIRHDCARAAEVSKIDLTNAYEQVLVNGDDVWKTAFSTIYGTYVSHVMQQGDCNAPSTFQRLMTAIFREYIGIFVHVYLDDLFVFSDSITEHGVHLTIVFAKLRDNLFYLSIPKCLLFAIRLDCLGHLIDQKGLHADTDKMARVRHWPVPLNYHDVQRFLGLVQYLSHFMPNLATFTGPLSAITRNGQNFDWRPLHQKCFEEIKALACRTPILRPIDTRDPDPIWVITDASTSGVGAVYGQGPEWDKCRPAGFMSKKFTPAQHSYFTFETEALGVLEALLKWEDKLLGRHFKIVTDHRALMFIQDKRKLAPRLERWIEYLTRFDFEIIHVEGTKNLVADSFSRYYSNESVDEWHDPQDMVSADARLDPSGETLSDRRTAELREVRAQRILEVPEMRTREAQQLAEHIRPGVPQQAPDGDPSALEAAAPGPPLPAVIEGALDIIPLVKAGYATDRTLSKVLAHPAEHHAFQMKDGLLWYSPAGRSDAVLCIPRATSHGRRLTEIVLDEAHTALGHLGARRTSDYVRRWYWWPDIGKEIAKFCSSCPTCQTTKSSRQPPLGLLHSMPIPTRPWESIGMDFVGPFPESMGFDYLWVVICRFTSLVHLIPTRTTVRASELAWLYLRDVVRLHGLASSIVSDRDSKFTSRFWTELHRLLGGKLLMSTAFHPQTDGVSERAIQTVSQILRSVIRPDQSDWVERLPLVEFAMNSSASATTGFAPFELNYGYMPRMIQTFAPVAVMPGVRDFAERAVDNLCMAHDSIIASRVVQTHYANQRRRDELPTYEASFAAGKRVYLSTENLSLPKGRARKLTPRFIGPYTIVRSHPETSHYTLQLPDELRRRRIHPTFHISRLRPWEPNDDDLFPSRQAPVFYDLGLDAEEEYEVDEIIVHRWVGRTIEFYVRFKDGDIFWENYDNCKDLAALDRYLELHGVPHWRRLPRNEHPSGAPNRP